MSNGIIEMELDTAPKDNFTLEKYLKGKYKGIEPDTSFKFYPHFRLPTKSERKRALSYNDSISEEYFKVCFTKRCKQCLEDYSNKQWGVDVCDGSDGVPWPTIMIGSESCIPQRFAPLYSLKGNVSEWSHDTGISYGGGWKHSKERILEDDQFITKEANAWTGFRNVCEWRRIDFENCTLK